LEPASNRVHAAKWFRIVIGPTGYKDMTDFVVRIGNRARIWIATFVTNPNNLGA
jgi:hypothetical protein